MKKIRFSLITLFPDLIQNYLQDALLAKAIDSQLLDVKITNLRSFSDTKYKSIDDTVFGGSDGMLFKYAPLARAFSSLDIYRKGATQRKIVYLSPQGKPWTSSVAKKWANYGGEIVLLCGRYAGIDQRVLYQFVDGEVSVGDFVLSGGELAALIVIESVSRFIPGVLHGQKSAACDSFESGLLEAPQFTKPQCEVIEAIQSNFVNNEKKELCVPSVLTSGNHQKIADWRRNCAILVTLKKRPDLLKSLSIDWQEVLNFYQEMSSEEKSILELEGLLPELEKLKRRYV